MKTYGGVDVYIHVFLTSAIVGSQWSHLGRCTSGRKTAPGTHWIGGQMAPRTGLDDVEMIEILILYRDSNSDPSVVQPVTSRHMDYAIPDRLRV
jgi:hypothetical protein